MAVKIGTREHNFDSTKNKRSNRVGASDKNGPAGAGNTCKSGPTPSKEGIVHTLPDGLTQDQKDCVAFLRLARKDRENAEQLTSHYVNLARQHGITWKIIGEAIGLAPDTVRMAHKRAVKRG